MNFLDDFPVATVTFLAAIVLIIIGYASNDIEFKTAFEALGYAGAGTGLVGIARAQSGKGLKR